ncbi:hypothetical protein KFL_012340020 [Klebsormidium nitens]|uniref:Uncharacterized protein n=1 Tax=Klebsormidium nitens TaxID=105231 RepID=A0A1Y1ISG1_KLENI|nr:hypothetical protein KFL_012340020 [Klebsormidium nitens]|eukprot:GAQ92982.1 hypothetical protein KFL_012340020 [Klebsormidium nitens]
MDLVTSILAHPRVVATEISANSRGELASVFIKAFDDKGNYFPIDFDDTWRFLGYSTKANGLRKLKGGGFKEGFDYCCMKGGVIQTDDGSYEGFAPDKYHMTINAFELLAMVAMTETGNKVRQFFRAMRDAYVELTQLQLTNREQGSTSEKLEKEKEITKQLEWQYKIEEKKLEAKKLELEHEYRLARLKKSTVQEIDQAEELAKGGTADSIHEEVFTQKGENDVEGGQLQTIVAAVVSSLAARIEELPKRRPARIEGRPSERTRLEPVQTVVRKSADGLFSIFDKLAVDFPNMKRDKVRRDFHAVHADLGNTIRIDTCPVESGTRPTPCCNAEDLETICEKIRSKMTKTSTSGADTSSDSI